MEFKNVNEIQWKDIYYNDKKTIFSVSEYGNVRNNNTSNMLKPCIGQDDRLYVCLSINGFGKIIKIHKLVYEAFIGKIPNGMTVDHIDENIYNNHYTNLQLLTRSENIKKYLNNHPDAFDQKYDDELIHTICKRLKNGEYYRDVAKDMNIKISYLFSIVKGKRRKNISSLYMPFPKSADHSKNLREIDYPYIYKCIIDGLSNKEIANQLDSDYNSTNLELITRIRKKIGIKDPKYFDINLINDVDELIKEGKTNDEIYSILSLDYNKRISWMMARRRTILQIPNNNLKIITPNEYKIIKKLLLEGKTNDEILLAINREKNMQFINLFGRLRQLMKKGKLT